MLLVSLLFAHLAFTRIALAQDGRVRLQLGTEGTLWAGQQVTLDLDLLTNGMSFSEIHFNIPAVEGAFLLQTDSSTVKLTERIDGESWQVLRYPLALYPQAGGELRIPPLQVRFRTAERFGAEPVVFDLETKAMTVVVAWPPGAPEGSLVVTTRDFDLSYNWTPVDGSLRPGEAVTLEVRRRAADTSAMLLPPLPRFETEGLASYPEAPEINDRSNRGALTGERHDRVTWVVEKAGAYRIPGIRFQWWDPHAERLREQLVPGMSFEAEPGPVGEGRDLAGQSAEAAIGRAWLALLALVAGISVWLLVDHATRRRLVSVLALQLARMRRATGAIYRRILPPPRALCSRVNPGPRP